MDSDLSCSPLFVSFVMAHTAVQKKQATNSIKNEKLVEQKEETSENFAPSKTKNNIQELNFGLCFWTTAKN